MKKAVLKRGAPVNKLLAVLLSVIMVTTMVNVPSIALAEGTTVTPSGGTIIDTTDIDMPDVTSSDTADAPTPEPTEESSDVPAATDVDITVPVGDADSLVNSEVASHSEGDVALLSATGSVAINNMTVTVGGVDYVPGQSALVSNPNTFTLTFQIGGDTSWHERNVAIDVPKGWRLVSAPGVGSLNASGQIVAKAYTPEEALAFAGAPYWVRDAYAGLTGGFGLNPRSGTLTYSVNNEVDGFLVSIVLQAEPALYDFTGDQALQDLKVTMTGSDPEGVLPASVDEKAVGAHLGTSTISARAFANTNMYANTAASVQDASSAYLGQVQQVSIGGIEPNTFFPQVNGANTVYNTSFEYVYPTGALVTIGTSNWKFDGAAVDNGDGTTTQKITSTAGRTVRVDDNRVDNRRMCILNLTYPKGSTFSEGDVLTTTVQNMTWQTAAVQPDESVAYVNHACNNNPTTVTTIIHEDDFNPPYDSQALNVEKKNGHDGVQQQLAFARMTLSGLGGVSGGSQVPVRFCYNGEDGTRLDNVSEVHIPTPSRGVSSTLTSIVINFSDGAQRIWTPGSGAMPGEISYHSTGAYFGTAWRYVADAGKYITSAYLEYSKVTETEAASNVFGRCYAIGRPINDAYTGTYSHHVFSVQQSDGAGGWNTVSNSDVSTDTPTHQEAKDHGGFRWEKPADFQLTATATNHTSSNSFDGIGRPGQEGCIRPGVTTLANYSFSNATGSFADTPVRVDFLLNQNENKDLVSQVRFPYSYVADANQAAAQVTSLTWSYTDGATGSWTAASGEPYPFTPSANGGTMDAPAGKYFASMSVELDNWNASTQLATALIGGRPEVDRYGAMSKHDIVITALGAVETEICATTAGFTYRNSTGQTVSLRGASAEANAGDSGTLVLDVVPGYRKSNGGAGQAEEDNQWYGHATFAFVLPNDVEPSTDTLSVTWPSNAMGYSATTATLKSSHVASPAELSAASMSGLAATVYVYELSDQDMTWIARYPNSSSTYARVSLPFSVNALSDNYVFTYGQLAYAGGNLDLPFTGSTTATTTAYTNGDPATATSPTIITSNTFDDLGVTGSVVRGNAATLTINRNPALVVQEHIAASDGDYKVYSDGNEATVANFAKNETGDIRLNVFNTVDDDTIVVKNGYVFVPIPKAAGNSNLVTDHGFDFTLNGVPSVTVGLENANGVEVRYVTGTDAVTTTTAPTIFNGASTVYNANANMVAFKLDDLKAGKGLEIHVPIKTPSTVSDDVVFDQFQASSVYLYNPTSWAMFESGAHTGYLRASYQHPDWTLTFNSENGSPQTPLTVEDGEAWGTLPTPTYAGETFEGWYTDETFTTQLTGAEVPSADATAYAKWSENAYTVEYDVNGGVETYADKTDVKWGEANLLPGTPTRVGYTFGGWACGTVNPVTASSTYSVLAANDQQAEVTLVAQWIENANVTIAYKTDGLAGAVITDPAGGADGTSVSESLPPATGTAAGSTAKPPVGYHFVNWTTEADPDTAVSTDATLVPVKVGGLNVGAAYVAHFAADINTAYRVEYYQQNVTGAGYAIVSDDTVNAAGTTAAAPSVTQNAYVGFTYKQTTYEATDHAVSGTALTIAADGSLVVKLYYDRNTHDVTYDANGHGTAPADLTDVRFGTTLDEPTAPVAPGYDFGGWFTDVDCTAGNEWNFATATTPDADLTLYAKWTAHQYKVNFANDGPNAAYAGLDGNGEQTVSYLEHAAADCTATVDTGYELIGWGYRYTAADGTTQHGVAYGATGYADVAILGDVTFHAVIFKTPFVSTAAVHGYVSIAETLEAAADPAADKEATVGIQGIDWNSLPTKVAVKFAPESENYRLDTVVIRDFNGTTPSTLTLVEGANTFPTLDKANQPVNVTVTLAINADGTGTVVTDQTVGSSLEVDVTYKIIQTEYTVKHWQQKVDGSGYEEVAADKTVVPAEAGSTETFAPNAYVGFAYQADATRYEDSAHAVQSGALPVKFDDSSVINLYYDRMAHGVTYNANGHGVAPGAQSDILFGALVDEPTAPTADGYAFGGWYTNNACTGAAWDFTTDTMPSNDVVLYAKWTANDNTEYKVEHYKQNVDGSYPSDATGTDALHGTTGALTIAVAKSTTTGDYLGFTAGPVTQATIAGDGSTVVRIDYTRNSYTLSFDSQGGSGVGSQTVKFEGAASEPTAPTRTGYSFGGWYQDSDCTDPSWNFATDTMPASDKALYAKWTADEYDITYDLDGGTVAIATPNPDTYTVATDTFTLTNPTKTGYVFAGWTGTGLSGATMTVTVAQGSTGQRDYVATWTPATDTKYVVQHFRQNLDDSYPAVPNDVDNMTGTTGTQTAAAAKDTTSGAYLGFTAGAVTQVEIAADGSTVIQIQYTRNSYTASFDSKGAGNVPDQSTKFGDLVAEPTTPYKAGYEFVGWYTSDGTENGEWGDAWNFSTDTMPAADVLLYAQWTPKGDTAYIVKHFQQNTDLSTYTEMTADEQHLTGTTGTSTAAQPKTYPGFANQTVVQQTIAGEGTTVVEIRYDRIKYPLTFDADGGSAVDAQEVPFGTPGTKPGDPTKDGFVFGGWVDGDGNDWDFATPMPIGGVSLTATWTPAQPVQVDAPVSKVVTGDTPDKPGEFAFTLTAVTTNAPMPEGSVDGVKTATLQGAGAVEFGSITYTAPGEYEYVVAEVAGSDAAYAYDAARYTMKVIVTQNGGALEAKRVLLDASGSEVDAVTFTNKYTKPSNPAAPGGNGSSGGGATFLGMHLPQTGDPMGMVVGGLVAIVVVAAVVLCLIRRRKKR